MTRVRAWRDDASHNSIAQKVAGSAFLIRIVSAALVFGSQILFARWMGTFEFGIYVSSVPTLIEQSQLVARSGLGHDDRLQRK